MDHKKNFGILFPNGSKMGQIPRAKTSPNCNRTRKTITPIKLDSSVTVDSVK
jgi:hypothetical protein